MFYPENDFIEASRGKQNVCLRNMPAAIQENKGLSKAKSAGGFENSSNGNIQTVYILKIV